MTGKRILCLLLTLCMALSLAACGQSGGSAYGVRTLVTLVEQEYSLAFRTNDPTADFVMAALEVLSAEGKVDELATKWFGSRIIYFERNANALNEVEEENFPREFIIGADINSFPMAYVSNDSFWGYDIELAMAVCDLLGWDLKIQAIEKENVYVELSSGNIDCAWGGIALNGLKADGDYLEYGPYVDNDIVIATRNGNLLFNRLMLRGKSMAMCSTPEALDALNTEPGLARSLGQITRLAGGTTECFQYLFSGKCDAILTDTTAIAYMNCH